MFDETHIGWLAGDDYEVAAALRQRHTANPDRPDETTPRGDLLGELLAGRWCDDDPPTAPATSAGPRPYEVADYVAAARRAGETLAPPARSTPRPRPYQAPGTPEALREFARRITGLHQIVPHHPGQMPMCSCGSVARICPVVNAAHEFLGHPVPWRPGDQPPPMPDSPAPTWRPA